MKKSLVGLGLTALTVVAMTAGTGVASAAAVQSTVPYTASSSDGGTCGNSWAVDLYNRVFTLPKPDPAGNYAIVEKFAQGHYSTTAGMSPGACDDPANPTGRTVSEGVSGVFSGNEHIFIQGGAYSAGDGSCNGFPTSDALNPCTNTSYIAYHYGVGATYTITTYSFSYTTSAKGTTIKKWTEVSTGGPEVDTGDISTS